MMKKLLPLLMVLLLLLAGCGNQTPQGPVDDPNATEPPRGLYEPASAVEKDTLGAVRAYRLEQNNYFGLTAMGSRLLLRAEDGTLTALQGDTCVVSADLETGVPIGMLGTAFDSSVQGAAYYLRDSREVVLINPQLQETDRIVLPEEIQGDPYISLNRGEIFYCVPGEIRALNMENGISRLIRSHSYPSQHLFGTWFDGELLLVCLESGDGTEGKTEYISADTGKTLYGGDTYLYPFHTWQDSYVLHRLDGGVGQFITGTRDSQAQALLLQEEQIASALPLGGVVGYTAGSNIAMRYYDLATGRCTAHVTLHGVNDPKAFLATEDYLWILACEGEEQLLYRWDITKSPANDDTVYTTRLITADDPDTEGLEMCRQRALEMGKQYGVKIHVWEDALEVDGGYPLVAEYQVETIHTMLDELEIALQQFPENFLLKTVEAGWIHINLVRQVDDSLLSAQYWHEGDCYIAITHRLNVTDEFYRGVAYAIDSHVLGNSRKLDTWNELNPKGFDYTYSDEPRPDQGQWLNGEGSAFLSLESLHYPHHDRAAVFFYAITENGKDFFADEVLQAKLEQLCRGIREAYNLEKSPDTYLWEQYLAESLAYTK